MANTNKPIKPIWIKEVGSILAAIIFYKPRMFKMLKASYKDYGTATLQLAIKSSVTKESI